MMYLRKISSALIAIMIVLLNILPAMADPQQAPLEINAGKIVLGDHLQYVEDAGRALEIKQIIEKQAWAGNNGEFNKGYSASAWWLKLTLANPDAHARRRLLEIAAPLLDHIDIYVIHAEKVLQQYRLGDKQTYYSRPIDHHNLIVPIEWAPKQTLNLYLRVQSTSSMQVPLILWSEDLFYGNANSHDMAKGLFFGAILLIAAYNLLLFFQLRDRAYLLYVCYVLGMTLFQFSLEGLAFRYLWPTAIWWNDQVLIVSLMIIPLCTNLFTLTLLEVSTLSPFFYWYSIGHIAIAVFMLPVAFVAPYEIGIKLAILINFLGSLCGVSVGPFAWIKGRAAGKYFTLAWTSLFLAAFALMLDKLGLIPRNWLTSHGLNIGVAAEVLLFSLSLADRINAERRARFEAQQTALQTVRQTHAELEQRVAERIRELDALNEELNIMANTDQLTGLNNRRNLEGRLSKEWSRCLRYGRGLAVALIDIDFFKNVNDSHGHQVGDLCLREISERIRNQVQHPGSAAARYGGEEFCILLPEADDRQAIMIAEGIRAAVSGSPMTFGDLKLIITISIGVSSTVPQRSTHPEWLLKSADCALYRAKEEGRNRVVSYEERFEKIEPVQERLK